MRRLLLLMVFFLYSLSAWSQERTVSGTVTSSDDGSTLPGVNVILKGTSTGTVTDIDGNYSISVPSDGATLVFSFVGLATQEVEVGSRSVVDIQMASDITQLSEVVVTALGIERSRNELPYAAQQVTAEDITRTRGDNLASALSGKVAGLNISNTNTMGGSTNVIIRGYSSITGNNQALFVIDGVPVSNANNNTADQRTGRVGTDFGNAAADINPDNIASVNVLKGAAATALYGSRAANGVIMITTKKGKENSLNITLNTGVTFGTIDKSTYAEYQDEYGAGYLSGFYEANLGSGVGPVVLFDHDASYGAAFDPNMMVYHWDALDPFSPNYQQMRPWVAAENDPSTFYETSVNSNQNIMITGGGDETTFKIGYTRTDQKGVLPNSTLDKDLLNLSASYDITEKLTITGTANYSHLEGIGMYGTGYNGNNPNQQFRQWWQTNVDIKRMEEAYKRNHQNITWNWADLEGSGPIYSDNPYWTRYENFASLSRDHYFGYAMLDYQVTDWMSIMGRASYDGTTELNEERIAIGSAALSEYERFNRDYKETNLDLIINFDTDITEAFSFRGLIGGNIRRTEVNSIRAETNGGLVVPGLYSLSVSRNPIEPPIELLERVGVDGIFAQASFGFMDMAFLELSGRRDQSTTLPEGENVYYYPSVGANFVFSELVENNWLTYGKLRLNYAEVGNDAPPLSLLDVYTKPTSFGAVPLFSIPNTKANPDLKSERTESIEAGIEAEFFEGRFGLDFSWYKSNTFDQIIPVSISSATGYTARWINSGEMENKGIEVSAYIIPVVSNDFKWTMNLNFSRNRNEVISLYGQGEDEVLNIPLAAPQGGVSLNAAVGEPYGIIRGTDFIYTNGQRTVNEDGYYMYTESSAEIIGDPNPDWLAGISNTFTFKGLSLSFLVDIRDGGDVWSLDQWYGEATGLYPETAGLNARGNPSRDPVAEGGGVLLSGVQEDGSVNDVYGENLNGIGQTPFGYASNGTIGAPRAMYIFDGSYVKLREVALTFSFPQSMMDRIGFINGIDVSLIGRNLWIIHKNMKYSDPEEGLSSGNIRGYQSGAYPTVRSYGFNLRFNF